MALSHSFFCYFNVQSFFFSFLFLCRILKRKIDFIEIINQNSFLMMSGRPFSFPTTVMNQLKGEFPNSDPSVVIIAARTCEFDVEKTRELIMAFEKKG